MEDIHLKFFMYQYPKVKIQIINYNELTKKLAEQYIYIYIKVALIFKFLNF